MDTLKNFAKKLQMAFPSLRAVALSPYIPGERDSGLDEDGFPFLVEVSLYSEKGAEEIRSWNGEEVPIIWQETGGWSVVNGFIGTMTLCLKETNDAVEGMDAFPLDLSEYKDKDGHVVWRRAIAFL